MRKYRGLISLSDTVFMKEHGLKANPLHYYYFIQTGEWVDGKRTIGSYQICDVNGALIPEYEECQFSRSRNNLFYLETYT